MTCTEWQVWFSAGDAECRHNECHVFGSEDEARSYAEALDHPAKIDGDGTFTPGRVAINKVVRHRVTQPNGDPLSKEKP